MGEDPARPAEESASTNEVMAAIDSDRGGPRLVIADITDEESWVSIPATAAATLAEWR